MIEWKTSKNPVPVDLALRKMQQRVSDILKGKQAQLIWLLEHPSSFTAGTSAKEEHLLDVKILPIFKAGRGGSYTYHGPGQRVIYVMLDLALHRKDIKRFVWNLEQWVINVLAKFGLTGERRKQGVGIWIIDDARLPPKNELKIASIGLRITKWVSYHGISINLDPNLNYYNSIVPCGNEGYGVTSLKEQGVETSFSELDKILKQEFDKVFFKD